MKRRGTVAAAALCVAVLCVALTACGGDGGSDVAADGPSPQPATGSATGAPSSTPTAAAATAPSSSPGGAATEVPEAARFGKSFTYAGGLTVRVDPPEQFLPSKWVERVEGTPMRFSVTIGNDTGEEFNPSQLHLRLRSTYAEAAQIFDQEQGVVARPENRLRDGRTVRFTVGYWVTDPDDLVLEFAPGFDYASTSVTS
jgi:hypothetical protein